MTHPPMSRPLVYGPFNVTLLEGGRNPRPGTAFVFSLENGDTVVLNRRLSASERLRYRYRYEVNLSDWGFTWDDQFPSSTGGFDFQVRLSVGWRIWDPIEVVRRNIIDASHVEVRLRGHIQTAMRPWALEFAIEERADAEKEMNARSRTLIQQMPFGIEVTECHVRLSLDEATETHLQQKLGLERTYEEQERVGLLAIQEARTQQGLQTMRDNYQNEQVRQRFENLTTATSNEETGLLRWSIAENPGQTFEILREWMDRGERTQQQKIELVKELVEKGLIQPADADPILQKLMEDTRSPGAGLPPAQRSGGPGAPSALPPAVFLPPSETVQAQSEARPEPPSGAGQETAGQQGLPRFDTGTGAQHASPVPDGVVGWKSVGRKTAQEEQDD